MWTDNDLRRMRRNWATQFRTPCSIKREGVRGVQDALGGTEYTESKQDCLCRVDQLRSAKDIVRGGQIVASSTTQIFFAYGTTITRDDQISVGGQLYAVVDVNDASDRLFESVYCTKD